MMKKYIKPGINNYDLTIKPVMLEISAGDDQDDVIAEGRRRESYEWLDSNKNNNDLFNTRW